MTIDWSLMKTAEQKAEDAAKAAQAEINAKARAYLDETGWYVERFLETGKPIPADISEARAKARASVVTF